MAAALESTGSKPLSGSAGLLRQSPSFSNPGAVFTPYWGEDAQEKAMSYIAPVAWLYYDAGKAKASPETIGISRP